MNINPRIYLRAGKRAMAEQLLHDSDVGPVVQQMRGAGMPEAVRHKMLYLGFERVAVHDVPQIIAPEHVPVATDKQEGHSPFNC